jgi:hypothetical protein
MGFMKRIGFVLLWLMAGPLQADFTVESEIQSPDQPEKIRTLMSIGGGNLRMEMLGNGPGGGVIVKPAEKTMFILVPSEKMYLVRPLTAGRPAEETGELPKVERTGLKEKISGYDCEQVLMKDQKGTVTEMWFSPEAPKMTEHLETFKALNAQNQRMGLQWILFMAKNPDLARFPVRVITRDSQNKEESRSTVLSFKTEAVPAALFNPPADYVRQEMGGLGGGPAAAEGGTGLSPELQQMMKLQQKAARGETLTAEEMKQMQEAAERLQKQYQQR